MEKTTKCIELLDFSRCWADWRGELKNVIESSHSYYQDETVHLLLEQLDSFLTKKICPSSGEEEVIEAMWENATSEERKTIATLFLKIADRL